MNFNGACLTSAFNTVRIINVVVNTTSRTQQAAGAVTLFDFVDGISLGLAANVTVHPQCFQTNVSTVANNGQVVAVSFPVFSNLSISPHLRVFG